MRKDYLNAAKRSRVKWKDCQCRVPGLNVQHESLGRSMAKQLCFQNLNTEIPLELVVTEGLRVLLVDDEEIIRELGRHVLESLGYRVLTARNGEEAIVFYETQWYSIIAAGC